jgi:hypothetical protein
MDTHANQQCVRGLSVLDHNEAGQVRKGKPTSEAGMPATMSMTLKKPCKFSPGSMHDCKHHSQHQFSEWIGRHDKCIHRKSKKVMKSNTAPSFKPQTPLTTSIPVGHSPTTSNAAIAIMVMKTKFSTLITKSSSQPLIIPIITSAKDNIPTVSAVPLLVA